MYEQVIGLAGSVLLGLAMLLRGRRGDRVPGQWALLQDMARSVGAVMEERAHHATTLCVLDRIGEGGRLSVTDSAGRQRVYECERRSSPGAVDE